MKVCKHENYHPWSHLDVNADRQVSSVGAKGGQNHPRYASPNTNKTATQLGS